MARRKPIAPSVPDPTYATIDAVHAAMVAEGATHMREIGAPDRPMRTYYRPSPLYKGNYGYTVVSLYGDGAFRRGPWLLAPDGKDKRAEQITPTE